MNLSNRAKAEKLLERLVNDYGSLMPPNERVFKKEAASSYIYNLFIAEKYKFSSDDLKYLFELILEKSTCKTDCSEA
jgi:hypothetical protein